MAVLICALAVGCPHSWAATESKGYGVGLKQALSSNSKFNLVPHKKSGFSLGASSFSGFASGISPIGNAANLGGDKKLYALLIDGRYDFDYETPLLSSPLQPFVSGGVGLASTIGPNDASGLDTLGGATTPLLRFGGGIAYHMDERWNLSLDYKAGLAPYNSGDHMFTGRSQQPVNLQSLNLGMHFAF